MPSQAKIDTVKNLTKLLCSTKSFYLVDFTGFNVGEINEIRREIKESSGLLKVIRNRLAQIAMKNAGYDVDELRGPTALLLVEDDIVLPLKAFYKMSKEAEKGDIKGGYIDGRILTKEEALGIARLPGVEVLQGQLVGILFTPVYSLLFSVKGILNKLVYSLDNLRKKREKQD